jgi:hypothetical protein
MMSEGWVVPVAAMPDCTGTLSKGVGGAEPVVDGSKPCGVWRAFRPNELRFYR